MKLKTRMIRIYAILCIIVACSIAFIYYYYNKNAHLNTEYQSLQTYSEQLSSEFDILIEDMNFAITYVIGEIEVLDGLKQLVNNQDNPRYPQYFKQEAQRNIRTTLMKNFLIKNFYQTKIINENGFMLTKEAVVDGITNQTKFKEKIFWLEEVKKSQNAFTLIGSHKDELNTDSDVLVMSMVKEIRGYEGSYIEVQLNIGELEKKLNIKEDIKGIVISRSDGEILYCTSDVLPNAKSFDRNNMITTFTSPKNDITIVVEGDIQAVMDNLLPIKKTAVLIVLLILGILLIYVNISAGIIVKPVKKLQQIMEITDLESMNKKIEFDSHIQELDSLAQSYEKLLQRLQRSILKSKKIEHLHLQAQFDSLQSKISPHFMSNVLNVISSRGLEKGDKEICQICSSLVALLSYAANTRDKTATAAEEIYYLEKYCYIIKSRYMQKFSYTINVPKIVLKQRLPQLALQQMVENSLKHGFEKSMNNININVRGWCAEDKWYICLQDNGQGFVENIIETIYAKAQALKEQMLEQDKNVELNLGGMGLVNLYLRMYFLFGDSMVFDIENNEIGAIVTIGGNIITEDGESRK